VSAQSRQSCPGPGSGQARRAIVNALFGLLLLLLPGTAVPATAQEAAAAPGEYRLLPGDEISVKLPLNPELDTSGPVGPDGRFSIPLAGRIEVGGMTLSQAEGAIATALRQQRIVADAKPGIVVAKYAGVVYVGGEVRAPGQVPLTQALNPLQAIIRAGGLLDTARSRKVVIVRNALLTPHRIETVNIRDIVKTGGQSAPLSLAAGDVVFVPKSTIAEVDLFIDQYVNRIVPNALHFNVNVGHGATTTTTADTAAATIAP